MDGGQAQNQSALARWVPRTKFRRPEPGSDTVLDPALVDHAAGLVSSKPLTLIVAAAGAGKTTLAAAAVPPDRCGWVRLDELDDDPSTLIELITVAVALEPIVAGGCRLVRQLFAAGLPAGLDPRRAAAVLINDLLESSPGNIVVVLDDLHCLRRAETLTVLEYLIEHLPPTVHVLGTARTEPGLSLARWRARGALGELGVADLALSVEQAGRLLNDRLGLGLSAEEVRRLVESASGWVTGVRLLGQAPGALDDYLDAELIGREPDDLRRFMIDTAVLEVLSPDACAALTGRTDAAAVLNDLRRRHGLFVQLGDRSVPDYRYHDLLRSFLLQRLRTTDPGRLAMLHEVAATVEAEPGQRIEHLLAAGAWDSAAELINSFADPLARSMDVQRVAAWAVRLPREQRLSWPRVQLITGLAAAQRGDLAAAVEAIDQVWAELGETGDEPAYWAATRTLHLATHDHQRYAPILGRLEHSATFAALPAATQAEHHLASGYGAMFTGDWAEVGRRVAAAITIATGSGDVAAVEVLALHLSPMLAPAPDLLDLVSSYAAWTGAHFPDPSPLITAGRQHQLAMINFARSDLDQAAAQARAATELIDGLGGLPYLRATVDWVLAGGAFARGDLVGAERIVRASLESPLATDLDRQLDLLRTGLLARILRLHRRTEELATLAAWLELEPESPLGDHAALVRTSVAAQLSWSAGDLAAAIDQSREGVELETRVRMVPFVVSPRIDLALLLAAEGRESEARMELRGVVGACAAMGAPGLLAVAGREIIPMLRGLRDRSASGVLATALHSLEGDRRTPSMPIPGQAESLSGREVDVLRQLEAGASNSEIAEALVISLNTVKTHVRNLLAKLGAGSRGEAVAIARRHHLL